MEFEMNAFKNAFAVALAFGVAASAAAAQDTTAPAAPTTAAPEVAQPAAPAAPQTRAPDAAGTTYAGETFGDWQLQCFRTEDGKQLPKDPCEMYQMMQDANGNAIADITMVSLPAGGQAVAGATIMAPLETLLTQNIVLKVDASEPKMYPFTFCAPLGCLSRVGLTAGELDTFKKGTNVAMTVVPMQNPDQPVTVNISLKGFTGAFDAVTKNAAAVRAANSPVKTLNPTN